MPAKAANVCREVYRGHSAGPTLVLEGLHSQYKLHEYYARTNRDPTRTALKIRDQSQRESCMVKTDCDARVGHCHSNELVKKILKTGTGLLCSTYFVLPQNKFDL